MRYIFVLLLTVAACDTGNDDDDWGDDDADNVAACETMMSDLGGAYCSTNDLIDWAYDCALYSGFDCDLSEWFNCLADASNDCWEPDFDQDKTLAKFDHCWDIWDALPCT